jgi:hypothetical protein
VPASLLTTLSKPWQAGLQPHSLSKPFMLMSPTPLCPFPSLILFNLSAFDTVDFDPWNIFSFQDAAVLVFFLPH